MKYKTIESNNEFGERIIKIEFVPESFFDNIKNDNIRPRRELIGIILGIAIISLVKYYSLSKPFVIHDILVYFIDVTLIVILFKSISFMNDINDIDSFISREVKNKNIDISFNRWKDIDNAFKYIYIIMILTLSIVYFSTYIYETGTRTLFLMIALLVFSFTKLTKFQKYTKNIIKLYKTTDSSKVFPLLNLKQIIIESVLFGIVFSAISFLFVHDTMVIQNIMYVVSVGGLYFLGKSLYLSRTYFYDLLIDIDESRIS